MESIPQPSQRLVSQDGADWIDYFKLEGVVTPKPVSQPTKTMETKKTSDSQPPEITSTAPAKSYVPATMTGLQDYSYWWQYAREHATTSETDQKSFRRGRIWA